MALQSPSRLPVSLVPPCFSGIDDLLGAANQRLVGARAHSLTPEKAHLYALGAVKTIMANELMGACQANHSHSLHRPQPHEHHHQKPVNG